MSRWSSYSTTILEATNGQDGKGANTKSHQANGQDPAGKIDWYILPIPFGRHGEKCPLKGIGPGRDVGACCASIKPEHEQAGYDNEENRAYYKVDSEEYGVPSRLKRRCYQPRSHNQGRDGQYQDKQFITVRVLGKCGFTY